MFTVGCVESGGGQLGISPTSGLISYLLLGGVGGVGPVSLMGPLRGLVGESSKESAGGRWIIQ